VCLAYLEWEKKMLNLNLLMLLPIIFISVLLIISLNHVLNYRGEGVGNNLVFQVIKLESLFPNSFSQENLKLNRDQWEWGKNLLVLSLVIYALILLFWFKYSRTTISYQLLSNVDQTNPVWNLDIIMGIDGVSLPFLLLIGFIIPLVFLSNWSTIDSLDIYYLIIIILLELFLVVVFLVIDLIMFYIFFESILPPLFILIGLYGASQKFRAGYYLFLYTLFGSLFMLLSFLKMGSESAALFYETYGFHNVFRLVQFLLWIMLFVSFSVKTPLVPVHTWLPLAHSDANVSGSIILASIVLKLALYGFLRILIGIFFVATSRLVPFFLGLCGVSLIYSSFTTIRQFDLKVLVAYSSIAHMASTLLGTFSDTLYGIIGSFIFGLAHGFVSPGLFILVGAVLYDRCGSRIINYYKGLSNILPLFALFFLVMVFGNMGVPLTGNFIGEFLSLLGAYQQNIFIATLGAISIILSAIYSIFMFNRVSSGSISIYIHTIPDIFRKEYYLLLPLLILTLILGIYPSFITNEIEFSLSNFLL
jgi:NADH-ubiquinone oxidoreductase chain 4